MESLQWGCAVKGVLGEFYDVINTFSLKISNCCEMMKSREIKITISDMVINDSENIKYLRL